MFDLNQENAGPRDRIGCEFDGAARKMTDAIMDAAHPAARQMVSGAKGRFCPVVTYLKNIANYAIFTGAKALFFQE